MAVVTAVNTVASVFSGLTPAGRQGEILCGLTALKHGWKGRSVLLWPEPVLPPVMPTLHNGMSTGGECRACTICAVKLLQAQRLHHSELAAARQPTFCAALLHHC